MMLKPRESYRAHIGSVWLGPERVKHGVEAALLARHD